MRRVTHRAGYGHRHSPSVIMCSLRTAVARCAGWHGGTKASPLHIRMPPRPAAADSGRLARRINTDSNPPGPRWNPRRPQSAPHCSKLRTQLRPFAGGKEERRLSRLQALAPSAAEGRESLDGNSAPRDAAAAAPCAARVWTALSRRHRAAAGRGCQYHCCGVACRHERERVRCQY